MPNGAKNWCFTWNNYNDEALHLLSQFCSGEQPVARYLIVGREVAPTTLTPHLQGFVSFTQRRTFASVRALLPDCHLEGAKGTPNQNREYCSKSGDFDEYGTLPSGPGKRSDWERFRDWCAAEPCVPSNRRLMEEWPALWGRYPAASRGMADELAPRPVLRNGELKQWQRELAAELDAEPDDRSIRFIVDRDGGAGKSWLCGYLFTTRDDVQLLGPGKRDDLAYVVDVTKRCFLINVGRGQLEYLNYGFLEMLKDRMVMSTKYQSQMKILQYCPHVVVLCNEMPDFTKMTDDRYKLLELS